MHENVFFLRTDHLEIEVMFPSLVGTIVSDALFMKFKLFFVKIFINFLIDAIKLSLFFITESNKLKLMNHFVEQVL